MAFKGDGSRNRGSGRADTNPKEARERSGGGGGGGVGGIKKAGNATVADHMIATGQIDVPSIGPNGVAQGNYNSQDDAYNDYASAVGDYATRSWAGRVLDGLLGGWFDQQEPISQNPRTFAGGAYHTSSNPGSIVGGMAGGLVNPALGMLTGKIGGWGYNALGGRNISHGGYSQPDTGAYDDPSGGWSKSPSGGGLLDGGGGSPSRQQDNRGSQNATGILGVGNQQAPAAATPLTAALPAQQQAAAIKKRAYDFGIGTVPGPSPYSFTTARWL